MSAWINGKKGKREKQERGEMARMGGRKRDEETNKKKIEKKRKK